MQFSDLTLQFPNSTNRLYKRLEELRSESEIFDMVRASPSDIGVTFPPDLLGSILAEAAMRAGPYQPGPLGRPEAREAVAAHYAHPNVSSERVLLTPGTSVSYWNVFKLLCNPGDNVLCPIPSYPLFDYIARLANVEIESYRLVENQAWQIDMEHLEAQLSTKTRAIVMISPHNPTGMVAGAEQIEGLVKLAQRHQLSIISDEVFRGFTFEGATQARPMESDAPLVFTLDGFSKMFALPGMKLGWTAVTGEDALVRKAMTTLELISDTFLPVNEIVQLAVPDIFEKGAAFSEDYKARVRSSRELALEMFSGAVPTPPMGGFYMVVPCGAEEEEVAIQLLGDDHVLVHPGYFYDIEGSHLVFSFLKHPGVLRDVLPRIRKRLGSEPYVPE